MPAVAALAPDDVHVADSTKSGSLRLKILSGDRLPQPHNAAGVDDELLLLLRQVEDLDANQVLVPRSGSI